VRQLFGPCDYTGLDCTPGECVDVVCLAHKFRSAATFDIVVSCEAFEHDPHLAKTLKNVLGRCLRPGGLFVGTWASPARREHGTARTKGELYGPDPTYYRGVSAAEFCEIAGAWLDPLWAGATRNGLDVYAHGLRRAKKKKSVS
jgi:SAM-dependent methyltransferase